MPAFHKSRRQAPVDSYGSPLGIFAGGVLFIVVGLMLFSALINLWPAVDRAGEAALREKRVVLGWFMYTALLTKPSALLLLSIVMGAIGGYIHAATSFTTYVGNRSFKASWGWWYGLRVFIGAALALLLYFAVRAGLLGTGGEQAETTIDPYGVALVSGLAGLFSKQATDRLESLFASGYGVKGSDRGDKLRPSIKALDPATHPAGKSFVLNVLGNRFAEGTTVTIGDQQMALLPGMTRTKLTVRVPADLLEPGEHEVTVTDASGAASDPRDLTITDPAEAATTPVAAPDPPPAG